MHSYILILFHRINSSLSLTLIRIKTYSEWAITASRHGVRHNLKWLYNKLSDWSFFCSFFCCLLQFAEQLLTWECSGNSGNLELGMTSHSSRRQPRTWDSWEKWDGRVSCCRYCYSLRVTAQVCSGWHCTKLSGRLFKDVDKGDGHIGILIPTSFLMMQSFGNSSNSSLCSQPLLLSKCEGERVLLSNCNAEEPRPPKKPKQPKTMQKWKK